MTQTLEPPSRRRRRRFPVPRWSSDPETRSLQIGIIGTLLVHLLLFCGARAFRAPAITFPRHEKPRPEFNIQLAPEEFKMPQKEAKPPPKKFVEANPDAPDNVPDKTNNFAAQNQQVAQEKPTPNGKNDMPAIEGQTEIKTTQIVDGRLVPPSERVPSAPQPETPPTQEVEKPPALEQTPLSGFEKKEGDDESGLGSNIAKFAPNAKAVPNKVEGMKDVPLIQDATATRPVIDPKRPQPRPSLVQAPSTRPAIFTENKFGTQNIGLIGVSAEFSNYGAYLQKMIETVQIQWDRILSESRIYPPSGSMVTVKFIMNTDGAISRIVNVDSHSTQQAAAACTSAITSRAPYGKWTDDMVAILGQEQEMTFSFYYQ
ncbi:hypothetical protein K0B96_10560 [Horticoccus luteus]|uniref:TonB C-terminal domain-containing protein n=1 Tax=Horticoccus luteus TaxID=2862869 RepID=A0A8F9TU08_9BACT|nr:hypothetical protein [Horticoccus luteus]QYM77764.1 hypothetical protein K0B96_10560 [Horticoccus luteus]